MVNPLEACMSQAGARRRMMDRLIGKMIGMRGLGAGAVLYSMLFVALGALVVPKAMAQTVAVAEVYGLRDRPDR